MKPKSFIKILFCLYIMGLISCEKEPLEPLSSFSINTSPAKVNQSVSFTNSSQNATSYNWDFGDGNTSSLQNPTHTYDSGGTYVVQLTAIGEGTSHKTTNSIEISEIVLISGDTPIGFLAGGVFMALLDGEVKNLSNIQVRNVKVHYSQSTTGDPLSATLITEPSTIAPGATATFIKEIAVPNFPTAKAVFEITWDH